jgi:hypothetical protein
VGLSVNQKVILMQSPDRQSSRIAKIAEIAKIDDGEIADTEGQDLVESW